LGKKFDADVEFITGDRCENELKERENALSNSPANMKTLRAAQRQIMVDMVNEAHWSRDKDISDLLDIQSRAKDLATKVFQDGDWPDDMYPMPQLLGRLAHGYKEKALAYTQHSHSWQVHLSLTHLPLDLFPLMDSLRSQFQINNLVLYKCNFLFHSGFFCLSSFSSTPLGIVKTIHKIAGAATNFDRAHQKSQ
jgi:hypothetical protein